MKDQSRGHVLVVDNNEDVLARLGSALTAAGYEAITTWSGLEALSLLDSGQFDALIVDNYVPDIYVGEFLDRTVALPHRLRIVLMQLKPAHHLRAHGSKLVAVVDKMRLSHVIAALANEHDGPGQFDPWLH
jgi:CheY-like chemotaxis protein